jgi:hypothetical protein
VDAPESSETVLNTVLVGAPQQTNRTVVISVSEIDFSVFRINSLQNLQF